MNVNDGDAGTNVVRRDHEGNRPSPWTWVLLGLAATGIVIGSLLAEVSSTTATWLVLGPSLVVFVLGARRTRAGGRIAGTATRRGLSFFVVVEAAGNIAVRDLAERGALTAALVVTLAAVLLAVLGATTMVWVQRHHPSTG